MTVAHLGGIPFEEWFAPLAASSSGIVIVLRAAVYRLRQRQ